VKCAVSLRDRLAIYVEGDEANWVLKMKDEIYELAQTPMGCNLLHLIGGVYQSMGRLHLGAYQEVVKQKAHSWSNNAKAGRSVIRSLGAARKMHKYAEENGYMEDGKDDSKDGSSSSEAKKAEDKKTERRDSMNFEDKLEKAKNDKEMMELSGSFMDTVWYISIIDIESTLKNVCRRLLRDKAVDKEARIRRATALEKLGNMYTEVELPKGQKDQGLMEFKQKLGVGVPPPEEWKEEFSENDFASAKEQETKAESKDEVPPTTSAPTPPSSVDKMKDMSQHALEKCSVKELKQAMKENDLSTEGCLEKKDFAERLYQHFNLIEECD